MKITNLEAVFLSTFIALIGAGLSAMNLNISGLILIILGALGILSVFGFNIYRAKTKVFPSNLIPWLFYQFRRNNPELFPELNETALKKEIAVLLDNRPFVPSKDRSNLSKEEVEKREPLFNEVVEKISLYPGPYKRYQLIAEIPKDHALFSNVENFLNKEFKELFLDPDFVNVYKIKPVDADYKRDWGCMVINSGNPFDSIVTGKAHWILFKR